MRIAGRRASARVDLGAAEERAGALECRMGREGGRADEEGGSDGE